MLDNSKLLLDVASLENQVRKHGKIIRIYWNPKEYSIFVGLQNDLFNLQEEFGYVYLDKPIGEYYKIIGRGVTVISALLNANNRLEGRAENVILMKKISLDKVMHECELVIEKSQKGGIRLLLVDHSEGENIVAGEKVHGVRASTISCCLNTMETWLLRNIKEFEKIGNASN